MIKAMQSQRYLRIVVGAGSLVCVVIAAACGLDRGGLAGDGLDASLEDTLVGPDTTVNDSNPQDTNPIADVIQPDTTPPPSCADAGGCLAEFDGGWTPYLHIISNAACPAADGSVQADYFDMRQVTFDPTSCSCGNCAADASCSDPLITIGTNNVCNNLEDAGSAPRDGSCSDFGNNLSAASLSISVLSKPQNPSCTVQQVGNQGWDAAVASICSASCEFDFCTAPKALYERCALAAGVHACPIGYKQIILDRPNTPAKCTACGCDASASCSGQLTMFATQDCTLDAGTVTNANQGCVDAGANSVRSAIYDAGPVQTTCTTSGSDASLALTNGAQTLCCK